jgi:hypothetical protein
MFDTPKVVHDTFNSSLPRDHYPKKRKDYLKSLPIDQQVTIKVDDLHPDITYVTLCTSPHVVQCVHLT